MSDARRSDRDLLQRMFDHLVWADDRVAQSLQNAVEPGDDALRIFSHVLGSEETWFSRIEGRPPTLAVWPALSVRECGEAAIRHADFLRAFISNTSEADLRRVVTYRNQSGAEYASRLDDILLHVCLHGAYHRGQVALLLRRAGEEPIPTDYIVYARAMNAAG